MIETGEISGRLVDQFDQPLAGKRVVATVNGSGRGYGKTDADGRFTFAAFRPTSSRCAFRLAMRPPDRSMPRSSRRIRWLSASVWSSSEAREN